MDEKKQKLKRDRSKQSKTKYKMDGVSAAENKLRSVE